MTAQGHPRAIFERAIERGNLVVAERGHAENPSRGCRAAAFASRRRPVWIP